MDPAPWDNLGYWRTARDYPEACRAMATLVGEAADLRPGHRVVDVGVGYGASLALWRDHFGVTSVMAMEPDADKASTAARRAPWARVLSASAHQLPTLVPGQVDAVLVVDAAYHFRHRQRFFTAAHRCLAPGGRLVLTDLLVSRSTVVLRAAARLCGIRPENLGDIQSHRRCLELAGFEDVTITVLEPWVLAGFAAWASARSGRTLPHRHRATAWLARRLRERVSYGLITAVKSG